MKRSKEYEFRIDQIINGNSRLQLACVWQRAEARASLRHDPSFEMQEGCIAGSKAPVAYFIQVFLVVFFLSFKIESLRDFKSLNFILFWSVNGITTIFYLASVLKRPGFIASNSFQFDTEIQQNEFAPEGNTDPNTAPDNFQSERAEPEPAHKSHTLVKNIPSSRLENRYKKKAGIPSFKTEFSTYRGSQVGMNDKPSARASDSERAGHVAIETSEMDGDNEKLEAIDFKTEGSIKSPHLRYETFNPGELQDPMYETEDQSPRVDISSDQIQKKQGQFSQFYEQTNKKYVKLSEQQSTKYTTAQDRSLRTESRSTIIQDQHKTLDISHDAVVKRASEDEDRAKVEYEPMQCTSCDILLPMRAKHCRQCGHCVSTFDHHCPWLGQCIGEKNRTIFFFYILVQLVQLVYATLLACTAFKSTATAGHWFYRNTLALLIMLFLLSMSMLQLLLCIFQLSLAVRNLTTWEALSWMKISYMTQWPSKYGSPFNLGWRQNLKLYFCNRAKRDEYFQWKLPKYLPKFGTGSVPHRGVRLLLSNHYYHCC